MTILCFQQHSRFVPSNSSREVESRESKSDKPSASYRLTSWFGFTTPQLLNFSTVCFHRHSRFVPRIMVLPTLPTAPSSFWNRRRGGSRTAPICIAGGIFRHLSFVFIDILALFREFWCAAAKLPQSGRRRGTGRPRSGAGKGQKRPRS